MRINPFNPSTGGAWFWILLAISVRVLIHAVVAGALTALIGALTTALPLPPWAIFAVILVSTTVIDLLRRPGGKASVRRP